MRLCFTKRRGKGNGKNGKRRERKGKEKREKEKGKKNKKKKNRRGPARGRVRNRTKRNGDLCNTVTVLTFIKKLTYYSRWPNTSCRVKPLSLTHKGVV